MIERQDNRKVQISLIVRHLDIEQYLTGKHINRHLYSSHAHLLAHLVSEALFPATQILPVIFSQFVSTVGTIRKTVMMSVLLGAVVTVTLAPSGLLFMPHELVKVVVVTLPLPLLIFASVVLLSLSAAVLLSLLLVAVGLTSSGEMAGLIPGLICLLQKVATTRLLFCLKQGLCLVCVKRAPLLIFQMKQPL